jgi:tripartite-type tricarboxylate transporter receptor subunit TctC
MKRYVRLFAGTLMGLLSLVATQSRAETWPTRPVHVIVPIAAGSNIDIVARIIANELAKQLGQPFIVENRPGAASTLGPATVARSEADGYTILFHSAAFTVASAITKNLPYEITRDFRGIMPIANTPLLLVVAPEKYKSVSDLIADAKAKNGTINYATVGYGSASHFVTERLGLIAGFKAQQIPFRGTVEGLTETMTGRVDFFFAPATTALSLVKEGRLSALATTGHTRLSDLPNVPTVAEAGIPQFDFDMWVGMFVLTKTPDSIIDKLYQETKKAIQTEGVRDKLTALGAQPMPPMSPSEFDAYVKRDLERDIFVARSAGITAP